MEVSRGVLRPVRPDRSSVRGDLMRVARRVCDQLYLKGGEELVKAICLEARIGLRGASPSEVLDRHHNPMQSMRVMI